jgi:hypothetical protein
MNYEATNQTIHSLNSLPEIELKKQLVLSQTPLVSGQKVLVEGDINPNDANFIIGNSIFG